MATVWDPPEGFDAPKFDDFMVDGRYDYDLHDKLVNEYIEKLATEARAANTGDLIGEVLYFPVGDGKAMYMVWKERPLQLVHLAVGDNWSIPEAHARGLRLADARQMVEHDKQLREIFGGTS